MDKQYVYDLLKDWKKESREGTVIFTYPCEGEFYDWGFTRMHSGAADLMDYAGLFLTVDEAEEELLGVCVETVEGERLCCRIPVGKGLGIRVKVSFTDFPVESSRETVWRYVRRITLETRGKLSSCRLQRRDQLYVDCPVRGRSAEAGETVAYEGWIYNCSEEPVTVNATRLYEGWESLEAQTEWKACGKSDGGVGTLQPGEGRGFTVFLKMHERVAAGGHETTRIRFRGQGKESSEEVLTLMTLQSLKHPFIYHQTRGWQQVRERIARYGQFKPAWQEYVRLSEEWVVTDPLKDRDYCYLTKVEDGIMATAYCYAVTGEASYGEKLLDFFRRFCDEEKGYPCKKKGCSQSYVQEGHFFQHIAIAYDILYDYAGMTSGDHRTMERCLRLYMEMLDSHIRSGSISNWLISEIQGAVYSAMVLQDIERVERFVFGKGGNLEQFAKGIFNDGWWFECSMGYNTWVSSMMLHMAHAMLNFGYTLVHQKFQVPFNLEVGSTWGMKQPRVLSGMYSQKWGGNQRITLGFKDMFDAVLPFLDYRGVMFGVADSDEKKMGGVHWGSAYDLAYTHYRDPAYIPVILRDGYQDPVFGHPELFMEKSQKVEEQQPEGAALQRQVEDRYLPDCIIRPLPVDSYRKSAYADNIGIAMLRSQGEGRPQSEQIQAVLRYGSHGGAHGHFDICDLLSVMRYGRSFFNPENCWWGYAHFMYKFYVQCSLTKNMVVVDDKMQIPADSKRILFHTGKAFQAAGVEVVTTWAYPPYGGMVYYQDGQSASKEELKKRCRKNASYLPVVEDDSVVYGDMSEYTEPVRQKRIMVVTDDYVALFDMLEGQEEHFYDSLMQIKGFQGIEGEHVRKVRHTEQMSSNPVSDAQFITDCSWYEAEGVTVAHFETIFTEEMAGGDRLDCDRSNYNEPGMLKMNVHTVWPPRTEQMVGRVAVYSGWAADGNGYTIPLEYRVEADGKVLNTGSFDAWILGRGECDVDITGIRKLRLVVKNGVLYNEEQREVRTAQALFWGQADIVLANGSRKAVSGLPYITDNIDSGYGIGRDYQGGRVTIVGTQYPEAIPTSPVDHDREGMIEVDLEGLDAVRFVGCIGCDAFPGDEYQKRRTYAVRTWGKRGDFVTVVEPFEKESVIAATESEGPGELTVTLKDGRARRFRVARMESENPRVIMESYQDSVRTDVESTCSIGP